MIKINTKNDVLYLDEWEHNDDLIAVGLYDEHGNVVKYELSDNIRKETRLKGITVKEWYTQKIAALQQCSSREEVISIFSIYFPPTPRKKIKSYKEIRDEVSQWLQNNGFEEASKALDCYYNL